VSVPTNSIPPIVETIRNSRRDLARLLSRIIDGRAGDELAALYPYTGHAHIIGITGAPGTGKSSLVNALARHYRSEGRTVGIVAVDPTSPFSGGAILGDRIRMRELSGDPGVFIRSMATRGALGGLAAATGDVVRAMDAGGFDFVLVETVGAGQSEVDIARTAQTTLVVEAPGLGDDVQAIKAGILEIADILVVNKADNPGLENTVRSLRAMLDLGHRVERIVHHGRLVAAGKGDESMPALPDENTAWQPPIMQTIATNLTGVAELAAKIAAHRQYLQDTGTIRLRERASIDSEITERLRESLLNTLLKRIPAAEIDAVLAQVTARTLDPASAVSALLAKWA
jgi:LAO/AO transport system kinase